VPSKARASPNHSLVVMISFKKIRPPMVIKMGRAMVIRDASTAVVRRSPS